MWLFTDVAASHWLYNNHRDNFDEGMMCGKNRDANQLDDTVKAITNDLPWAAESIGKIEHFKPSKYIKKGFEWVKKIEEETNLRKREGHQYDQLIAIADHEQGEILQPLIYDNPDFSWWAKFQRSGLITNEWTRKKFTKYAYPTYELTFTHACEIDDPKLKSVEPDDMIVENLQSRMDWITKVAEKFHDLMLTKNDYMTQELQTMASWVDTPDAAIVY